MPIHPQVVEIDGAALKAEADKSHEFRALAHYGAQRNRNREVTDIEQMRKSLVERHGENLDAQKWLQAFETLQKFDMGALILGRNGSPHRFRWNYSLKAIGAAAESGIPITAYRIVPKKKGDKIVNDYHSSRPTLIDAKVNRMGKNNVITSTRNVEVRTRLARPFTEPSVHQAAPQDAGPVHHIYIALRPDYTFEADLPKLSQKEADVLCAAIKRCAN